MSEKVTWAPWYDRNPETKTLNCIGAGVTPHAPTVRWTYTIPEERMFIAESMMITVYRTLAPVAAGWVWAAIEAKAVAVRECGFINDAVNTMVQERAGRTVLLKAGDTILGWTKDISNGGECHYSVGLHGVEFDAFPIEYVITPFEVELPKPDVQEPVKDWIQKLIDELNKLLK